MERRDVLAFATEGRGAAIVEHELELLDIARVLRLALRFDPALLTAAFDPAAHLILSPCAVASEAPVRLF